MHQVCTMEQAFRWRDSRRLRQREPENGKHCRRFLRFSSCFMVSSSCSSSVAEAKSPRAETKSAGAVTDTIHHRSSETHSNEELSSSTTWYLDRKAHAAPELLEECERRLLRKKRRKRFIALFLPVCKSKICMIKCGQREPAGKPVHFEDTCDVIRAQQPAESRAHWSEEIKTCAASAGTCASVVSGRRKTPVGNSPKKNQDNRGDDSTAFTGTRRYRILSVGEDLRTPTAAALGAANGKCQCGQAQLEAERERKAETKQLVEDFNHAYGKFQSRQLEVKVEEAEKERERKAETKKSVEGFKHVFREIDGESPQHRKMRYESFKHVQASGRAMRKIEAINRQDEAHEREMDDKTKAAYELDPQIQTWSGGKEGNLRALLSTLHNILWPECEWKEVSWAELEIPSSVKKAYRRAAFCVHPDKVQQKGGTVQHKYVAQKVFGILRDAWNKFYNEELANSSL